MKRNLSTELTILWDTAVVSGGAVKVMAEDGSPFLVLIPSEATMGAGEASSDDLLEQVGGLINWWEIGIRNRYEVESLNGALHSSRDGVPYVMIIQAEDLVEN